MTVRNVSAFLLEKFKEYGIHVIYPLGTTRLVNSLLDELPRSWHGLTHDALLKKIREVCELNTTLGLLKRKRESGVSGYVYHIV